MARSYVTGLLGAVILVAAMTAGQAQTLRCEPEKAAEKYPSYAGKVVKIGASPTQPPYAFADPANPDRMAGLEVELIENALKCAGLKYDYQRGTWVGLLSSMFSGAADVMVGNVNYRPDRAEKVDFVLYTRAGSMAVVAKGNPKKIVDVGSLCGRTGSAIAGGSSSLIIDRQSKLCVESGKPAIDFQPATDPETAYRQVKSGRAEFAMDDIAAFAVRVAKDPETETGFTVLSGLVGGFVVPKGNAAMLAVVTDGLKIQEQDGTIAALMKKYNLPTDLLIPVESRK